ncbi:hypothetical protein [Kocuria sabuli]|uniref:hypothetical protein n=1 Tax=Kocuria sabuli TaxID=3071448 RepID=UPI0034D3DD46
MYKTHVYDGVRLCATTAEVEELQALKRRHCLLAQENEILCRADIASVAQLNYRIRACATGWNDRCHPLVWASTSTEILTGANHPTASKAGHQQPAAHVRLRRTGMRGECLT